MTSHSDGIFVTEKTCKKCGKTLAISEFYRSKTNSDGHLNKCKKCTSSDVNSNRQKNIEHYREYDRKRGSLPHRVDARKKYGATEAYAESHRASCRRYAENHADRRKAQLVLGKAVHAGKVEKLPCFVCGEKAEAHHPDYSSPLDVVWLCHNHHNQIHHHRKETTTK